MATIGIEMVFVALCLFDTLINGQQNVNGSSTFNENVMLPEIAYDYKFYCPEIPLCTESNTTNISSYSCCGRCNCLNDCYKIGNCCPDILHKFTEPSLETCVLPQFLPYGLTDVNLEDSVFMVNKCPTEYQNMEIRRKCENIPFTALTREEFELFLPVTSAETNFIYRNLYCGICNGEPRESLTSWNVILQCNSLADLQTETFEDLLYILNTKHLQCNLLFENPVATLVPQSCDWGFYTKCNQTGNMVEYDTSLNHKCESFTSIFLFEYRNVFCFMCNGLENPSDQNCGDPQLPRPPIEVHAFTALLNFNVLDQQEVASSDRKTCSSSQRYDSYKEVCRNMTCASGSSYVKGKCVRKYAAESARSYEIYLQVRPTSAKNICVDNIDDFLLQTFQQIFSLFDPMSRLKRNVCDVALLYHPGQHQCLNTIPVAYALVHVKIYSNSEHSVDNYLTELSSFDRKTFETGTLKLSLNIDSGDYGYFAFDEEYVDSGTRVYVDPSTQVELLPAHWQFTSARKCEDIRTMRIIPTIYCPRVRLNSSDFDIVTTNDTVCLEDLHLCFNRGWFVDTDTGYEICEDLYFGAIQNSWQINRCKETSTTDSQSNVYKLVTLVCTLISMIFLLLAIITYSLFEKLRTTPGVNNLCLCVNMFIAQGLFQFGMGQISLGTGCVVIGMLVHFFWLSTITWMNICSLHMFRVFGTFNSKVISTNPHKTFFKYTVYSVTVPLLPVLINVFISLGSSDWTDVGYGGCMCYISSPKMILYTFAIPVSVLLLSNIVFFIIVAISIRKTRQPKLSSNQDQMSFTVYMKLSCLTGAFWIFGFLDTWFHHPVFAYAFIILSAGQGFFIFWSFIFSKRVLQLYVKGVKSGDSKSKSSNAGPTYTSVLSRNNMNRIEC